MLKAAIIVYKLVCLQHSTLIYYNPSLIRCHLPTPVKDRTFRKGILHYRKSQLTCIETGFRRTFLPFTTPMVLILNLAVNQIYRLVLTRVPRGKWLGNGRRFVAWFSARYPLLISETWLCTHFHDKFKLEISRWILHIWAKPIHVYKKFEKKGRLSREFWTQNRPIYTAHIRTLNNIQWLASNQDFFL